MAPENDDVTTQAEGAGAPSGDQDAAAAAPDATQEPGTTPSAPPPDVPPPPPDVEPPLEPELVEPAPVDKGTQPEHPEPVPHAFHRQDNVTTPGVEKTTMPMRTDTGDVDMVESTHDTSPTQTVPADEVDDGEHDYHAAE